MTPQIIAVANLKGGTGKTTSTAFLAHAFVQLTRKVLVVDADPQKSISEWAEMAEWEIPTVSLPSKQLHRRLKGIPGWAGYDVVLIDTPPFYPMELEDGETWQPTGVVDSALRVADRIVVPLAPTTMELQRVRATLAAISRTGEKDVRFLLNRTVSNASSTPVARGLLDRWFRPHAPAVSTARKARAALEGSGVYVFRTEIKRLESLAQSMGEPVSKQLHGYLSVAMELEESK